MLKFNKVTVLPGSLEPDTFYFVVNGDYAESYLTNAAGVAKAIGNSAMINALIDAKLNAFSVLRQVTTIAARDADKAGLNTNAMYLVTDATGDATVASGAALYFYNKGANTFTKVAEYESLDVVLQWSSIQGKPNSTPSAIDTAVGQAHTHANRGTLDKLGEASGKLTFNGSVVTSDWTTTNW